MSGAITSMGTSAWDDPDTTLPGARRTAPTPAEEEPPAAVAPPAAPMPHADPVVAPNPLENAVPRAPKVTRRIEAIDLEVGPSVAREHWVREPEPQVWETSRMLITGKRPIASPQSRPLPRPQRFRARSPYHSVLLFAAMLLIVVILLVGAIKAATISTQLLSPSRTAVPMAAPTAPHSTAPGLPH
jgi:hypothetical protein